MTSSLTLYIDPNTERAFMTPAPCTIQDACRLLRIRYTPNVQVYTSLTVVPPAPEHTIRNRSSAWMSYHSAWLSESPDEPHGPGYDLIRDPHHTDDDVAAFCRRIREDRQPARLTVRCVSTWYHNGEPQ